MEQSPPSPNEIESKQPIPSRPPKKRRSIFGLRAMISQGLGGTIGGPIFAILGFSLAIAKTGMLISIAINGLLMLSFIMIFSELALSLPIAGGGYSFSKEAIGGAQGFLIGWLIWIGNLLFAAVSGLGFSYSLLVFFPTEFFGVVGVKIIGFTVTLLFYFANIYIPHVVNTLLKILTYTLVAGFLIYIVLGFSLGIPRNPDFSTSVLREPLSFSTIISMTGYTFIIYCVYEWNSSFENLTARFDDIKQPRKNIPRAFIFSILIAIVIYWLVYFVTLLNIGKFGSNTATLILQSDAPLADAFQIIVQNPWGLYFMAFIGLIATITSINAGLQMSSHILHSMSRDGFIHRGVQRTRKSIQWVAMTISTILILLIIMVLDLNIITEISNFIFLVSMFFLSLSLIILRKSRPNLIRPWKAPLYPYLPIFNMISSFGLIIGIGASSIGLLGIVFGIVIVILGGIYYLFQISRRDRIYLILHGAKFGVCGMFILFLALTRSQLGILEGESFDWHAFPVFTGILYGFLVVGALSLGVDVMSIRRTVMWMSRRRGDSMMVTGITQLSDPQDRRIRRFVWGYALLQFGIAFFFIVCVLLCYFPVLSVASPIFSTESALFTDFFIVLAIILSLLLVINGIVCLLTEQEVVQLGTAHPASPN